MNREDEIRAWIADHKSRYPDLHESRLEFDHLRYLLKKVERLEGENAELRGSTKTPRFYVKKRSQMFGSHYTVEDRLHPDAEGFTYSERENAEIVAARMNREYGNAS